MAKTAQQLRNEYSGLCLELTVLIEKLRCDGIIYLQELVNGRLYTFSKMKVLDSDLKNASALIKDVDIVLNKIKKIFKEMSVIDE
jgi:hypothetical protein